MSIKVTYVHKYKRVTKEVRLVVSCRGWDARLTVDSLSSGKQCGSLDGSVAESAGSEVHTAS